MGYQSKAELEDNLIKKLGTQGYSYVKRLVYNFRVKINKFNKEV